MNDDLMFDYLVQMGAMRPEQDELKRKQAVVDALRKNAMAPMEGQMAGKVYVGPGLAQGLSQVGQAYLAKQQQDSVDQGLQGMNTRQAQMLQELRKRRNLGNTFSDMPERSPVQADPYAQFRYGRDV